MLLSLALLPIIIGPQDFRADIKDVYYWMFLTDRAGFKEVINIREIRWVDNPFNSRGGLFFVRAFPWENRIEWGLPTGDLCRDAMLLRHEARHFTQYGERRTFGEAEPYRASLQTWQELHSRGLCYIGGIL